MSQFFVVSSGGGGGAVSSVTGTNGVTASPTTGAVVVSGVNATTSTVGVASFNATDFNVVSGAVSLANSVVVRSSGTVDYTVAQLVPLFTTGPGQYFSVQCFVATTSAYNTVTSGSINGSLGWTGPGYNDLAFITASFSDVNQAWSYNSGFQTQVLMVPPSTTLYYNLTTPGIATAFAGKIAVYGFYVT